MRIFITGASGWIGSATTAALLRRGHDVVGMARSDAAAETIAALGAQVHRGDLNDLNSLRQGAQSADAVIHLGYHHNFSQMPQAAALDRAAIDAFGEELRGSGRALLIASGTAGLRPGEEAVETDMADPTAHPRIANTQALLDLAESGIRPVALRFPPTVHGAGDHGFIATLVDIARRTGVSGYVGEGINAWSAVHRLDAAEAVASAVERQDSGPIIHAVAEAGVATKDIAKAIGNGLNLPVESVSPEDAAAHFEWLGAFFGMDARASSAATRARLNWKPTHPTLLEDLTSGVYFETS